MKPTAALVNEFEKLKWITHVFANSPNGTLITDASGLILDINPAFTAITGYRREEVVGQTPKLLSSGIHDRDFYGALWQSLLQEGAWRGEITNRRKDGKLVAELLAIHAIHDETGQVACYVGNFCDLDSLKTYKKYPGPDAHHDLLTRLPSKALLLDRIQQAMAWMERQGTLAALCLLDITDFEQMNLRHGHTVGDAVLVEIAERLRSAVREGDTVARLEGNTFAVLIADIDSDEEIKIVVDRMTMVLAVPLEQMDGHRLSASIGLSIYPLDSESPQQLLDHARQALQIAKQLSPRHPGKSSRYTFDADGADLPCDAEDSLPLLREALNSGEFQLYYQPILNLQTGRIDLFSGTIRWHHPEQGLLAAKDYLPRLPYKMDQAPLAVEFDLWTIKTALEQLAAWEKQGISQALHVNISLHLLHWSDFQSYLAELLATHPASAALCLGLRMDDNAPLSDLTQTCRVMADCKNLGIAFVLNNFGRSYASLTYLKYLPAHWLKMDASLIRTMLTDAGDMAMVESILGLAKAFGHQVIAAGVGAPEQLAALAERGCAAAEGHGIADPMEAAAVPAWLAGFQTPPG